LKDDNTIRKSMLKLVKMVQKLKNDKNRDDSLLFSWALLAPWTLLPSFWL